MGIWDWLNGEENPTGSSSWGGTEYVTPGQARPNSYGPGIGQAQTYSFGVGATTGASANKEVSDSVLEAANEYKWQHGKAALTTLGAKPYRFNAPLHPSMRKSQSGSPYDTTYGSGDLRTDWGEEEGRKPWRWRLGQLVADASSAAYKPGDYRYGFRFLYNPTSISFSTPQTSKYSIAALANSDGLESRMLPQGMIQIELLLNRIADVTTPTDNYTTGKGQNIPPEELALLQSKGTMYDIDYLYRTINGLWSLDETTVPDTVKKGRKEGEEDEDKKGKVKASAKKEKKEKKKVAPSEAVQTGDIGMLLPTASWLSIGRAMRYYGWVQSISYTHEMFSEDMIPLITRLQMSFARVLIGSAEDFKAIDNATAIGRGAMGDNFEPKTASASGGGTTSSPDTVVGGAGYPDDKGKESNEFYIWNSIVRAGYTKATAGGILGNLEQESGFDPTADQAGGPGRGIAQWSEGDRWETLKSWCKKKGRNPESIEGQVGYMLYEMGSGTWGSPTKYKSFSDPVDACIYFHDLFERSADSPDFVRQTRGGDARKWYNKFKDKEPTPSASSNTAVSSVFVLGDSLTVGSAPYIRKGYKGSSLSVTINAETSRPSSDLGPLDSEAASSASLWIIALGTNDFDAGDFKDSVRRAMNKAGSRSVRWLNIYNASNPQQTSRINGALNDMAREYSNLIVIDFADRLNKEEHVDSSGYHLTAAGYRARAKLYVVTVVGSTSLGRIGG